MPKVDLDLFEKDYPPSFLYRVNKNSLTLINRAVHNKTFETVYFQGKVDFDDINAITVHSRSRRFKTNIWGAAIGGAIGYFVGKTVARKDFNQFSIELINQRPTAGWAEPIIGTIVGASIGIAIGDLFTPVTIRNVNRNPRKASMYLRGLSRK
jgi:hypothetical protein